MNNGIQSNKRIQKLKKQQKLTNEILEREDIKSQIDHGTKVKDLLKKDIKKSRATIYRIAKKPELNQRGRNQIISPERRQQLLQDLLLQNNSTFPTKKKVFVQFLRALIKNKTLCHVSNHVIYDEYARFEELNLNIQQSNYEKLTNTINYDDSSQQTEEYKEKEEYSNTQFDESYQDCSKILNQSEIETIQDSISIQEDSLQNEHDFTGMMDFNKKNIIYIDQASFHNQCSSFQFINNHNKNIHDYNHQNYTELKYNEQQYLTNTNNEKQSEESQDFECDEYLNFDQIKQNNDQD